MSRIRLVKLTGSGTTHIDINSHNITRSARNKTTGGALETERLKPHDPALIEALNAPVPSFKPTDKFLKSKNLLLNNLSINDISDLKNMLGGITNNQLQDARKVEKIKNETIKRVASSVAKIKSLKPRNINVRGSLANKKMRLKRKNLI